MPVLVSVFGSALATLVVVVALTGLRHFQEAPTVPMPTERWLVDHLLRIRGVRRVVPVLDRYVWGGAMVGIGLVTVLFAAAVVGWILSTVDSNRGFARFDESAAEWGSANATATSTDALRWITHLGGSAVLITLMAAVGLVAALATRHQRWALLGFLLTVGVGITIVNNGLKLLVDRDRPDVVTHLAETHSASFPSGHSASAAACWAALAVVAGRRWPRQPRHWLAGIAAAIAVLVASSRVLLGVHWLTDVIAGVIVGWTWFFVVFLIFGGRLQRFGEPIERAAAATGRPVEAADNSDFEQAGAPGAGRR
jgi:membrane-associated phospholipid phosphatase